MMAKEGLRRRQWSGLLEGIDSAGLVFYQVSESKICDTYVATSRGDGYGISPAFNEKESRARSTRNREVCGCRIPFN
jgi:hypothetical protein